MSILLYVLTILSLTQCITKSQAIVFEALTPCDLTASDGGIVKAYCEETITPCTLTASNGAIVQAYCERNLVSQPLASITGISALLNSTGPISTFQILGTSTNTIAPSGSGSLTKSLASTSLQISRFRNQFSPPIPGTSLSSALTSTSAVGSSSSNTARTVSLSSNAFTNTNTSAASGTASTAIHAISSSLSLTPATARTTSRPSAQISPTTALIASTTTAARPYCEPGAEPDFREGSFCTCLDGNRYTAATQGTTPASLFNACPYTSGSLPQTTMAPNMSHCEFDGPADCSTTSDLNIQSMINQANDTFHREELSNCSTFIARAGYPGINGAAAGDSCIEYFNITSHMLWWWSDHEEYCAQTLNVGFANCFYDLTWRPSSNCTDFAANYYCQEPFIDYFKPGVNQTLDFYVAWNIYNFVIWSYSYWTAVQFAQSDTTAMIWNDTLAFEHIKDSFPLGQEIMLGVLTFALGILSPSGWGRTLPGNGGATAVENAIQGAAQQAATDARMSAWILQKIFAPEVPGEYLLRTAQQAPGLIRSILVPIESGTINHAIYTSASLTAQLTTFGEALSQIIADIAVSVPDNVTLFAEWTHTGYYFVPSLMTEQDMVSYIKWGLNTYVISEILSNDDVFIVRQVDTNPYELQHNASSGNLSNPKIIGCEHGYNEWNQCGTFWWDSIHNVAYSLLSASDNYANYSGDLTSVFNNNLTTPEQLFLGSQVCQDGYNESSIDSPFKDPAGGLMGQTTACLSNLAVCTWNIFNGSREFVEPWCYTSGYASNGYNLNDCAHDYTDVPMGYLGWYLYNGAYCEGQK